MRNLISALLLSSLVLVPLAASPVLRQRLSDDEVVTFNKETLKYHCVRCTWAKRCTDNCTKVTKSEAKRKGGVACKVCGGGC